MKKKRKKKLKMTHVKYYYELFCGECMKVRLEKNILSRNKLEN